MMVRLFFSKEKCGCSDMRETCGNYFFLSFSFFFFSAYGFQRVLKRFFLNISAGKCAPPLHELPNSWDMSQQSVHTAMRKLSMGRKSSFKHSKQQRGTCG